jgi:hypothetical protein
MELLDIQGEITIDHTQPINSEGAFCDLFCGHHPTVSALSFTDILRLFDRFPSEVGKVGFEAVEVGQR